MPRKRSATAIELPKGVFAVLARGRFYYYFQDGRGTKHAGPRYALGTEPRSPEFWQRLRQAQGLVGPVPTDTIDALIDAYLASPEFLGLVPGPRGRKITDSTRDQYRRGLRLARAAWGALPATGLRPSHVKAMMNRLAKTPGKANTFLVTMKALSTWARLNDQIDHPFAEGVTAFAIDGGHKPWTPEQIRCAHENLTGAVRRAVMLGLYTGQRPSDVIRLGWTDVDEGGFHLRQAKTGRNVWCPIVPELAAEMAAWERRPGPFVLQASGRPYDRKLLDKHFAEIRDALPALAGTTLHGLRATAVIRLRRAGLELAQIEDIVGMSLPTITRYSRFADKKASGKAALFTLNRRTAEEQDCKTSEKCKTESK